MRGPLPYQELAARLAERGITAGLDVSSRPEPEAAGAMLLCVTELTPPEHVDALVEALQAIGRSP